MNGKRAREIRQYLRLMNGRAKRADVLRLKRKWKGMDHNQRGATSAGMCLFLERARAARKEAGL
jgi:hypothetical protein